MSKEQINALAADIYSMLRSDSMSRAMASMLYGEGWRKQSVGEWIEMDTIDDGWKRYSCNDCGWNTESYYKEKYDLPRYCPNCGAKMKGE